MEIDSSESSTSEELSASYSEQEYRCPRYRHHFAGLPSIATDVNKEVKVVIRVNGRPWRETDESDDNRKQ